MENTFGCLTIVAVWLVLSFVAGSVAERKGLRKQTYVLLSLLLSPLVGLIIAFAASPDQAKADQQRLAGGSERQCPFCAELVKSEAIVCRFCGRELLRNHEEYLAWKDRDRKPTPPSGFR
jgi:hypothetical protein